MSWIDYTLFAIIALSVVIGLVRGFVREAISLITWVLAFWVAIQFSTDLSELFAAKISTPSARHILSFLLLFIVTLIIGALVNYVVHKLVVKTGLTGTDRFIGALFGAIRGVLVIVLFGVLANWTLMPETNWWQASWTLSVLENVVAWLAERLPESMQQYMDPEAMAAITVLR